MPLFLLFHPYVMFHSVTPKTAARQAPLSSTLSWSLLKFMSMEWVMCNQLILCFPFSFTSGGQSTGASTSASVFPLNIQDWFPLGLTGLTQGTLKGLLQHQNLKASIIWCSAFSMVQLSHPYMTTGKTIVLTIWTFISKVMSLIFNMLCRFLIDFLPREGGYRKLQRRDTKHSAM